MTEPHTLSELLTWYRSELLDALPLRLHQRDLDAGGAPDWHPAFRRWLTAPPTAEDREGNIIDPLRFHLRALTRDDPQRGMFLMMLAVWDFDVIAAVRVSGLHSSPREALRRLWNRMYTASRDTEGNVVITPNIPYRGERCRAQGCRRRTFRVYCRDHEGKSEAQINAESVDDTASHVVPLAVAE